MEISAFDAPFGAQVVGLSRSWMTEPATVEQLNRAFVNYAVLCLRNQSFASADDFLAAARQFGLPMAPVTSSYRLPGYDVIEALSNHATDPRSEDRLPLLRGGSWHTDHSNLASPPKATMLYAIEVPDTGGNTEFVNLTHACAALPESLKKQIAGRRVFEAYLSRRAPRKLLKRSDEETRDSSGVWQPLVRRHPQTGLPGLYLNPMRDDAVEDLAQDDADELLDSLYEHCDQPRFQYSHRWLPGDVLIWDNRCLWHRATFDFDQSKRRYLHRIMLAGETPVAA